MDLQIIPYNAAVLSHEEISHLELGQDVIVGIEKLTDKAAHFTAHSVSGEKHIRLARPSPPYEPCIDIPLASLSKPLPLLTLVTSANEENEEDPSKGMWFGYNLPDDVDYIIMDLVALPKETKEFTLELQTKINNTQKSRESFDTKTIRLRNCSVIAFTRSTNHSLSALPCSIVFQQNKGRTIAISRVEYKKVIGQVVELRRE